MATVSTQQPKAIAMKKSMSGKIFSSFTRKTKSEAKDVMSVVTPPAEQKTTIEEKTELLLSTSEATTEDMAKHLASELESAHIVDSIQAEVKQQKDQKYELECVSRSQFLHLCLRLALPLSVFANPGRWTDTSLRRRRQSAENMAKEQQRKLEADARAAESKPVEVIAESKSVKRPFPAMATFLLVLLPLLGLCLFMNAYKVEEIPAPDVEVPRKALCVAKFCLKLPKN